MTDKQTPPDWVLIEAAKRCWEDGPLIDIFKLRSWSQNQTGVIGGKAFRALCDMIAKYEQPPVDRKLLCAREAAAAHGWVRSNAAEAVAMTALKLWEEGFGA